MATDGPQRPAGQIASPSHHGEIVAEDDKVSGIIDYPPVGPLALPDRQNQVGGGQDRAVVDAIPHHGNRASLSLESTDDGDLVRWESHGASPGLRLSHRVRVVTPPRS